MTKVTPFWLTIESSIFIVPTYLMRALENLTKGVILLFPTAKSASAVNGSNWQGVARVSAVP